MIRLLVLRAGMEPCEGRNLSVIRSKTRDFPLTACRAWVAPSHVGRGPDAHEGRCRPRDEGRASAFCRESLPFGHEHSRPLFFERPGLDRGTSCRSPAHRSRWVFSRLDPVACPNAEEGRLHRPESSWSFRNAHPTWLRPFVARAALSRPSRGIPESVGRVGTSGIQVGRSTEAPVLQGLALRPLVGQPSAAYRRLRIEHRSGWANGR